MWSALALAPTSAAPGEPLAESGILAAHQSSSLPTATGDAPDAVIVVGIQHGWLTVDLRRAPLAEVLWMIGDRAGLRVLLHGELGGPITAAFTALALDQGIRRLIRGHSFALTYAPSRDGAGQPVLTEVRVYGATPADGAAVRPGATGPPRPEPSAAAMAEAAAEQEQTERMEGVATLAQLGDAASVPALAQALATEPDAFVRAKAVRVLGHVGGEPALATLKRWPVTVSYFDKTARDDQLPVYSIRFEVYENGVSRALMLDYNDFAISGELTSLELRNSAPCR